jgi:hypothetical protein
MNLINTTWLQASSAAFILVIVLSVLGMLVLPASVLLYMRRRRLTFVASIV